MRDILLVLHIVLVCIWLGANIVQGFVSGSIATADVSARLWWAEAQGSMARVLYNIAGIGIFVTGLLLLFAVDSPYEISDPFISIGFLAVIIGAGLGMGVFGPGCRALVDAIRSGNEAEEKALVKKLAMFGVIDSVVVVLTIWAMVATIGWP